MKKNSLMVSILALLVALSLTVGVFAGSNSTTPVTSTLQDIRADNTPYRLHSDSPLSGKNYYKNGVESMISQLQSSQEWELSALSSTTRKMFVDFNDPVAGSATSNAPIASGYVTGRFVTKCYLLYNTTGKGYPAVGNMIGLNSTRPCPMVFRFDLNGTTYHVMMNSVQYGGTDDALATCTNVVDPTHPSTSQCNAWSITPTATNGGTDSTGQPRNLTRLTKTVQLSKGQTTEQTLGDYYMTFNIGITNP